MSCVCVARPRLGRRRRSRSRLRRRVTESETVELARPPPRLSLSRVSATVVGPLSGRDDGAVSRPPHERILSVLSLSGPLSHGSTKETRRADSAQESLRSLAPRGARTPTSRPKRRDC